MWAYPFLDEEGAEAFATGLPAPGSDACSPFAPLGLHPSESSIWDHEAFPALLLDVVLWGWEGSCAHGRGGQSNGCVRACKCVRVCA